MYVQGNQYETHSLLHMSPVRFFEEFSLKWAATASKKTVPNMLFDHSGRSLTAGHERASCSCSDSVQLGARGAFDGFSCVIGGPSILSQVESTGGIGIWVIFFY